MHVEVHTNGMIGVGVVSFGCEDEDSRKFRVTIQGANASNNVAIENLEGFACDDDFTAD